MTGQSEQTDAPVLVWFRSDLRVNDNPALTAAAETGLPVICVFIRDEETPGDWKPGGASQWWLHHSLSELKKSLEALGSQLVLKTGTALDVIAELIDETGADTVYWNRRYEVHNRETDTSIKSDLRDKGLDAISFKANLLIEPWEVETKSGDPFKVFTPFWKASLNIIDPADPLLAPKRLKAPDNLPDSDQLDDWTLLPTKPDWSRGLMDEWEPGEAGAARRLKDFLETPINRYKDARDIPSDHGTSKLSPHLAFGEISPRQIWAAAQDAVTNGVTRTGADKFLSEIGWREFSHNLLYHFPDFPEKNFQPKFNHFPWSDSQDHLKAWQEGQTGYPIVDAGMRQLWQTGWMHNRVRMIVGSFLVKHLLIDWREGEAWFWDTLVDADLANNSAGWQWIAGSGADAAPYFRIFNPMTQGEKFDPDGAYVRQWVPELKHLPDRFIHQPWEAGEMVLKECDIELGKTYPYPIVDHKEARERALSAFQSLKDAA